MIDGLPFALLTSEFGQVWAEYVCHDVTLQLWHDVTPKQRLKCKGMDGGTNVMITYDATKMDIAYSDGIINDTPLFHQMVVNM